MSFPSFLLAPLEIAINKVIQLDPLVIEALSALSSHTAAVHLQGLEWTVFVSPHSQGVLLLAQYEGEVEAHFSAPPLTLLRFVQEQDRSLLQNGSITTQGDPQLIEAFANTVLMLDIDWQGVIASIFGELPASFLSSSLRVLRQQVGDIFHHLHPAAPQEHTLMLTRQTFTQFHAEQAELERTVDELARRVAQLERTA